MASSSMLAPCAAAGVSTDVEERTDVWMAEGGNGPRFTLQALAQIGI